jgi:pre-mRNA-splicing factor CWC22
MSSVDFEEAGHKLLKIKLEPGQEVFSPLDLLLNLSGIVYGGCALLLFDQIWTLCCLRRYWHLLETCGMQVELCVMLLECCSQERTYLRYYGLLGQRFCMVNRIYQQNFDDCFVKQYSMIHRLETNKLRNVAKFFAHLLGTDALPWQSLAYIRLTEEDTTSSSRIFIKILFQVWGYALSFGELYTGPFLVKTLWGSVCMLQLCCLMWNSWLD